ncbi:MAG: hypothetical protein VW547_11455, partial [Alphaproteobacteria bacterium]
FKLAEVVKNYLAGLPMGFSPQFVVMNRKAYDALNPAQKKAIDDSTGIEWSLRAARLYEAAREEGIALVKSRSDTTFTEISANQKAEWDAKFKTLAGDWVGRFEKQGFKDYGSMLAAYMGKGS